MTNYTASQESESTEKTRDCERICNDLFQQYAHVLIPPQIGGRTLDIIDNSQELM